MVPADKIKWAPAPPSFSEGAQVAPLRGDPSKSGPYTTRMKVPDGYKTLPHWHSTDEYMTILQGVLVMGLGEKFDPAAVTELGAGSFIRMPKGARQFVWAKGQTIIQVHGMGPLDIHYVNAADDPRKE